MCRKSVCPYFYRKGVLRAVFLLCLTSYVLASTCPPKCVCPSEDNIEVYCDGIGLDALPKGSWPSAKFLSAGNNGITELKEDFLSTFPNLQVLYMDENPLKELNLEVFTVLSNFSVFSCVNCQIEKIVPLPAGKELPFLSRLQLRNNSISKVAQNLLDGISGDYLTLDLKENLLYIPGNRPFLYSNSLKSLELSSNNCSSISSETFRELRSIDLLDVGYCNISKVTNQFKHLENLQNLLLNDNPLKELSGTILPPNLQAISFRNSSLQFVDLEVVDRAVNLTFIDIDDTPMACNCSYEELFNWAQSKDVMLNALCSDNLELTCSFYNSTSRNYSDCNTTYNEAI